MKLTDTDGIDGPFNRAMDRAIRDDRGIAEHLKSCDCGGCRAFDAQRFGEMRSVIGHSASDFAVVPMTAATITDEQIRELLDDLRTDGEWSREFGQLVWSRQDDMRACYAALAVAIVASKWTRETARARCAEILNARRSR